MTDKRGNQTNYDLGLNESGELSTVGDLFNPGHPDSGREPRDPQTPVAFDQGQDISRTAKTTLGAYLSSATKGNVGNVRPNTFQVTSENNEVGAGFDSNLSSRRAGLLARSDIENNGVTMGTYLDHVKGHVDAAWAARKFESTKNSDYGRNSNNPFVSPEVGIKNYADPATRSRGQDGNSILLNIDARGNQESAEPGNPQIGPLSDNAPIVQKKISEVLKQNRFNPIEKAFVQNHNINGNSATLQRKLGSYVKDGAKEIRQDLLEQVGLKLMIRATGHSVPGQDLLDSTNNLQLTNNLAPLIPSAPQLTGLPLIDTINLRAGNVAIAEDIEGVGVTPESARAEYINDIYPDGIDRSQENSRDAFTGKTYGVLNSHIEPFSGGLPIGTFTTTIAGIIAIVGSSFIVTAIPLILNGGSVNNSRQALNTLIDIDPSGLTMGRHTAITDSGYASSDPLQEFIFQLLGIPKTNHQWEQCLLQGIGAFFGVGIRADFTIDEQTLGENIYYLATAPGYYAGIIRNAIRDTEQIVRAIEDFASAVSNVNVISAISGIFKIIESITTSALYRFFMAMITLGNQVLNQQASDYYAGNFDGRITSSARFDAINLDSDSIISDKINKDIGRSAGLKWKHSAARALYILPRNFSDARASMGRIDNNEVHSEAGLNRLREKSNTTTRIDPTTVRTIEDILDSEYMPFYFHDVRTNEVISFHAFLGNLSDSYSANYTNTAGYGRTDEVMIYNNTKRSISFDFTVAATSEEDLDVMYWNINKLVSMLYPQYSQGRVMVNGDNRFVQPFSQIATASPLIRLRIGDMVKSNYSKFGLSRIFGLGQSENINNMHVDPTSGVNESEVRSRLAEALLPIPSNVSSEDWTGLGAVTTADTNITNVASRAAPSISTGAPSPSTPSSSSSVQRFCKWYASDAPYEVSIPSGRVLPLTNPMGKFNEDYAAYRRNIIEGGRIYARRGMHSGDDFTRFLLTQIPRSSVTYPAGSQVKGKIVRAYALSFPTINEYAAFYVVEVDTTTVPSDIINQAEGYEGYSTVFSSDANPEDPNAPVGTDLKPHHIFGVSSINGTLNFSAPFALTDSTVTRIRSNIINEISPNANGRINEDIQSDNAERIGFFNSSNNPVIKSFESAGGRGLAGFITSLNLDHSDSTWETVRGSRAPKLIKLSVNFSPIHDLPLGLDADGMMKSVPYNVGKISNAIGGDVYSSAAPGELMNVVDAAIASMP